MGFIDGSVTSIVAPAIRASLDTGLAEVQWVSNAYLLTLSSLLLLGGAAGDRFGLRKVFALGILVFVVASLACAFAGSAEWLIAARAIQGIGAAFMVPGSLAIIAVAYPKDQRGGAIGTWAAASSLTTLMGPVFGGLLLTWFGNDSWRWVFALNLPLGALALGLLLGLPADSVGQGRKLDIVGAALATIALLFVSWAFMGADISSAWIFIGFGVVAIAAFIAWEARTSEPMLPLKLFADFGFTGAQVVTFLIYFGISAVMFYLSMVMIVGWLVSPAEVAIAILPFGVALTLLSTPAGHLTDRLGPGPVIAMGGAIVALAFVLLGATAGWHAVWFAVFPLMALFGIGMSAVAGPISTAVMGTISEKETGTASAINNAVSRVAGLLAIASMGSFAVWVFSAGAPEGTVFGVPLDLSVSTGSAAAYIEATDAAFAAICYFAGVLSACAAILSWFSLPRRR
ncbi:MFS transporter [Devosia soli]|nr:MFS transporter [Devosia soli]